MTMLMLMTRHQQPDNDVKLTIVERSHAQSLMFRTVGIPSTIGPVTLCRQTRYCWSGQVEAVQLVHPVQQNTQFVVTSMENVLAAAACR